MNAPIRIFPPAQTGPALRRVSRTTSRKRIPHFTNSSGAKPSSNTRSLRLDIRDICNVVSSGLTDIAGMNGRSGNRCDCQVTGDSELSNKTLRVLLVRCPIAFNRARLGFVRYDPAQFMVGCRREVPLTTVVILRD